MTAHIKKWGNSSAVRIPADVMIAADLTVDDPVSIRVENGMVIIEAAKLPHFDLDAAIAAITPENSHDEVDWGPPVGNEAW
jgi:antitoxin MazE